MNGLTVYAVPHTHWDREWYFTRARFQMMNVDMMDRLLDIMAAQPDYVFLLDGQLIALEDYLRVCPERAGELREYIAQGRLAVGPWYVLPDEYLCSGEAHIRNFIEGTRLADGLGGAMRLGYLPDSFGHPSQMPQIIRALGMGELIFWRGPGPEIAHSEFIWEGRDGSRILALNMVYGYSNGACLPAGEAECAARLDHEIDKLGRMSALGLVLIMNGSDHIAPDADAPAKFRRYAQARPDVELKLRPLTEYAAEAHARAQGAQLQLATGELRSGYRAYLLGDTLSTRMPLKQLQRRAEVMLENHLEPMLTMLDMAGLSAYPEAKLRHMWRLLLANLPHDSICGCGVDAVHAEMLGRYAELDDCAAQVQLEARRALGDVADDGSVAGLPVRTQADEGVVTVFATLSSGRRTQARVVIERVVHPLRYVDYDQDQRLLEFDGDDAPEHPTGIVFTAADGTELRGEIESCELCDTVEPNMYSQPTMNRCLRIVASFCPECFGVGWRQYAYRLEYGAKAAQGSAASVENEFFRVTCGEDGALDVLDKRTGARYDGLARLADAGDAGDEYTFDPIAGAALGMLPGSIQVDVAGAALVVRGVMRLPESVGEVRHSRSVNTVDCAVRVTARALPGVERVDVRVGFDNRARDHRLTALFPLGARAVRCVSDSLFSIDERAIVRDGGGDWTGWMERPNNSFFMKNMAALTGEGRALAVFAKGLPQFEVECGAQGDSLRLTLLRCVGWLSRKDLDSRDGNGGWTLATPGAQEQGMRAFEFAICPHAGLADAELYARALEYVAGVHAVQTARTRTALRPDCEVLRISAPGVFVSALKRAEDGCGYVARLVNMTPDAQNCRVECMLSGAMLRRLTADERELGDEPAPGALELALRPWQFVTVGIEVRG